jgi:hypothetical protein
VDYKWSWQRLFRQRSHNGGAILCRSVLDQLWRVFDQVAIATRELKECDGSWRSVALYFWI